MDDDQFQGNMSVQGGNPDPIGDTSPANDAGASTFVLGEAEKTDALVERILNELFSPEADGFPGDEDNGSMGAWYILASLGMYPICPGDTKWVTFKRSVKSVKVLGKEII